MTDPNIGQTLILRGATDEGDNDELSETSGLSPNLERNNEAPQEEHTQELTETQITSSLVAAPVGPDEISFLVSCTGIEKTEERKRILRCNEMSTQEDKRRKVDVSYTTKQFTIPELDTFTRRHVITVVKEDLFPKCKFLVGEGSYVIRNNPQLEIRIKEREQSYGMSHEKIDITQNKTKNYARIVMEKCHIVPSDYTWEEMGLWWRMYCGVVKKQLSQTRSRRGHMIKGTIQKGE